MFETIKLDFSYSLTAPTGGGKAEMEMKTNYDKSVIVKNFYINDDAKLGPVEFFSYYSTGLAIFFRQTSEKIEFFSNKEFRLNDDGLFILCD